MVHEDSVEADEESECEFMAAVGGERDGEARQEELPQDMAMPVLMGDSWGESWPVRAKLKVDDDVDRELEAVGRESNQGEGKPT